jgi:hypothetical protein
MDGIERLIAHGSSSVRVDDLDRERVPVLPAEARTGSSRNSRSAFLSAKERITPPSHSGIRIPSNRIPSEGDPP